MDFVVNRGMRRWYIQSAFAIPDAAKRLQEMRPFSKIPDSFLRIVIPVSAAAWKAAIPVSAGAQFYRNLPLPNRGRVWDNTDITNPNKKE